MLDNRREQLKEFVEREFVGPDPIEYEDFIQENGEEILISDPPRIRYLAGILFPVGSMEVDNDKEEESDIVDVEDMELKMDDAVSVEKSISNGKSEIMEDAEELIDRSNAYNQSAMSLTIAVKNGDSISASVTAGTYSKITAESSQTERKIIKYLRKPLVWNETLILPDQNEIIKRQDVGNTGLRVDITFRYRRDDFCIYTFSIENTKQMEGNSIKDEDCFFQVKMRLESEKGFHYLPEGKKVNADEDYMSNQLLYRNVKNYAIGHGCAAEWDDVSDEKYWIETAVFPSYEVKPIVPSVIPGVDLSMLNMSKPECFEDVKVQLGLLCEKYDEWITVLKSRVGSLDSSLIDTAQRHIENCEKCLSRMRNGVSLLSSDSTVSKAFQLMNRAMLMQQIHYGLPLSGWIDNGEDGITLDSKIDRLPLVDDDDTWYAKDKRVYGKWRPFQLAFILMNLESMRKRDSSERDIVDLIWFPTGGGKTEAYLGLSAYTIFIRRMLDKTNAGTAILMRYTLRLLTAQQYERAAAVICACEIIRSNDPDLLGEDEINIGLWVGGDTTPNHIKDAIAQYNDLKNHRTNSNPFVMLKCPWCGAQMGVVDTAKGVRYLPGYKVVPGPRKSKKFVFRCSNKELGCDFSSNNLPLYIIDDDIYEKKPTLVLGTVDKFAMLPFRPEAQGLFGYENGKKVSAPDLIIQDELHLISGPLGSMVGHYETMISELCGIKTDDGTLMPKIVASTATISRAKEQCHALYGCGVEKVFQFPPAGLDAGDSFFAEEDRSKNGRKYVGILASGSPSDATTAIRLYAALLYGAKKMNVDDEKDRDPYWTNVGYYNSIRELGHATTWIRADIDQHLDVMYKRRNDHKRMSKDEYRNYRRYINRNEELTSRIPGDMVTASLANLNISYPSENVEGKYQEPPIDICLATNMISVGLDVQRLGLMTVAGQPKTTSEYIQATSRVGRDANNAPGEIFVLYRPGRPRDKSYYEQFKLYHSKLYCYVEPTSVTPFSAPVRERALHAIIIGMMRLSQGIDYNEDPPKYPDKDLVDYIRDIIEKRVKNIDLDELDNTMHWFDHRMEQWEDWNPQRWTPQINPDNSFGNAVPLMYGAGNKPNAIWGDRGLKTPTSMRSVDASCEAAVLQNRYHERSEDSDNV